MSQLCLFTREQLLEYSQALCKYRDQANARWDDLRRFQKAKDPEPPKPDYVAIDLHYPDESRTFMLGHYDCPDCGYMPRLFRIVRPIPGDPWRKQISFHINCSNCGFTSPSFDSSQKAGQYWKCVMALSR